MSRRSIRKAFRKFGRKLKRGFKKIGKFMKDHKKIFIALGVGIGLSMIPGVGPMLSKGAGSIGKMISANPGMTAKLAIGGIATKGAIKGGKGLVTGFENNKSLILGSLGLFSAFYIYKKIK